MRGIGRVPPASEKGEELRDVILWLSIIELGKTGKNLTFITGDSGFWDGNEVKPNLRHDIKKTGTNILMYRSVEDFVKEHAPAAEEASPLWVAEHKIDLTQDALLFNSILDEIDTVVVNTFPNWAIHSLSVQNITLRKGTLYRTGEQQQFAELTYSAIASGTIERKEEADPAWWHQMTKFEFWPATTRRPETTRQPIERREPIPFAMDITLVIDAYVENNAVSGLELDLLRREKTRLPDDKKS
jgi:hypothetical protein